MGRVIVVAPTRERAIAWCLGNGVQPYRWDTRLVTTPGAAHGLSFTPDDRVVYVAGVMPSMAEALAPCYLGGGRDLAELRDVTL